MPLLSSYFGGSDKGRTPHLNHFNHIRMSHIDSTLGDRIKIYMKEDETGYALYCTSQNGVPPTTTLKFAKGCVCVDLNSQVIYINTGDATTPVWSPSNGAIQQACTATSDGLLTGQINEVATHVVVTSSGATQAVTLPSGSAEFVGKKLTIWVGANGFELLTPATSGATVNNVDSDGTNQVDIPANTLSELVLVATNTWLLRSSTALGAVATAIIPDND